MVIAARDAAGTLGAQLGALAGQRFDGWCEVIVVDNGSRDATVEVAEGWRGLLPGLRVLRAPDARGAAGARNIGGRESRGDLLLFCDADDVVGRDWMTELAGGLARYPAVGGSIDRHALNDPEALAWRPARPTDALPDSFAFLPWTYGANLGVRKHIWADLGGFDERFRYSEDVAFCWQLQLAGHTLGFIPGAVVSYRYRTGLRATAVQSHHFGSTRVQLYKRFKAWGMPRSSAAAAGREWRWIAGHSLDVLRSRQARGVWLSRTARSTGRLAGSFVTGPSTCDRRKRTGAGVGGASNPADRDRQ